LVVTFAGTAAAYTWLATMLLLRGTRNWHSRAFATAAAMTAVWAAAKLLPAATPQDVLPSLRDAAWIATVILMIRGESPRQRLWQQLSTIAVGLVAADLLFCGLGLSFPITAGLRLDSWVSRMSVCALGLLLLENMLRNSPKDRFWALKLFGIGLALIFSFNLVFEIPHVFAHTLNHALVATQPLIYLLALPLFVVTAVRMPTVNLRVHSSRQAVFHSATLIAIGVMVEGMAVAAYFVRSYGGSIGTVLAVVLLFSAAAAVLTAAASTTLRSRLRLFINENFFNYKYDYRVEWSNFIASLSARDEDNLPLRVLRTLGDLLDSPGGLLLIRRNSEDKLVPLAHWSIDREATPMTLTDAVVEQLENDGLSYVDIAAGRDGALSKELGHQYPFGWLGVPLRYRGRLIGFAILNKPRAGRKLDWEDQKLISLVAQQLALYLVHDEASKDLADARQLEAFNQRIAFVIHDMKSNIGQLSLLARNAERFGHDEQFRKDMVDTIRHSAEKLQELLQRLKGGPVEVKRTEKVDLCALLKEFAENKRRVGLPVELRPLPFLTALTEIDRSALLSVLEHVVSNAIEAAPESPVVIGLDSHAEMLRITVQDLGRGMAPTFLTDELFRPLRSTKGMGLGLGAYQAKQTMRDLRGNLEIRSKMGAGTTVELVLPATRTAT
jgi:putative PEP-CTERM system histidine kinase